MYTKNNTVLTNTATLHKFEEEVKAFAYDSPSHDLVYSTTAAPTPLLPPNITVTTLWPYMQFQ